MRTKRSRSTEETSANDKTDKGTRRLSRRRRRVLWAVGALVVVWGVAAVVEAALGVLDDSHGMSQVQMVRSHLSASDVVHGSAISPMRGAGRDFAAGTSWLNSPLLDPVEIVPVIGRQLRSARDLSSAATKTADIGVSALTKSRAILGVPHNTGPARITTLRNLAQLAAVTDDQLGALNPGSGQALLSPLASKHDTFVKELDQLRTTLHKASTVSSTVAQVLEGPSTYLVLMANNAEMRAGSGMFLEAGVLTTGQGNFTLSDLQPTAPLALPVGKVPVSGDLEADWGSLEPGVDWRNLGLTPQFDVNGPLAARMWAAKTGQQVDGVFAIDVETIQGLMDVTGPVTLPDGTVVDAGTAEKYLMHDQYNGLTDDSSQAEQARQEQLGSLTRAVFGQLQSRSLDLKVLSDAMVSSAQGRHLMLWSSQPRVESAWEAGGVAGQVPGNSLLAAVMNGGGNKLDQYVSVSPHLALSVHGGKTQATLTVRVANTTPPGQSQFLAGPYPGLGLGYGEYVGFLAVNVPGDAQRPVPQGCPHLDALGAEGSTWLVSCPIDVKAGQTQTFTVRFTLPSPHGDIAVVPSARIGPETWTYEGQSRSDGAPFTILW